MIRVSRKQVKATAGAGLLPSPRGFRVRLGPARVSRQALPDFDHIIIVAPPTLGADFWKRAPAAGPVRRAWQRLGADARGRPLRAQLAASTGITFGQLGDRAPSAFRLLRFAGDLVADALATEPRTIAVHTPGLAAPLAARVTDALLLALGARSFQGPAFGRKPRAPTLRSVTLLAPPADLAVERRLVEADATNLVRWLTALPPNRLTARTYRELLTELARTHGWQMEWLDEARLRQAGCGAFLAVSQGNATRDAGIAHLRYRPGARNAPPAVALVGKGIVFDTGGTNLKDAKHMLEMHTDMAGSAVAVATLAALTRLGHQQAVDCWLAITENRPGNTAYKQRDVVTACNGTTIEVMHTDAEGRMVLADTLALAGRSAPGLIIDYATLTGACVNALSERYSGVFTNRPVLNDTLVATGRASGERVWPFPMDDDFDDDLKSQVADTLQCTPGNEADHIFAARFLQRFVPRESAWIHVDLAAAVRKDGLGQVPGGPTGFGVRLTLALLLDAQLPPDLRELPPDAPGTAGGGP
jgi:leucyl aminopeptidase